MEGRVSSRWVAIEWILPLFAAVLDEVSDARRGELSDEGDPVPRSPLSSPADVFQDLLDHVDPPEEGPRIEAPSFDRRHPYFERDPSGCC